MNRADRITGVLLLSLAVFVATQARQLPQWEGTAPGPGSLPFWLALLMAAGAVALLARSFSRVVPEAPGWPDRYMAKRLGVVAAFSIAAVTLIYIVGMTGAMAVYMAAVLFYLQPHRIRVNIATSVLTAIVIWFVFGFCLGVPLPRGLWL